MEQIGEDRLVANTLVKTGPVKDVNGGLLIDDAGKLKRLFLKLPHPVRFLFLWVKWLVIVTCVY